MDICSINLPSKHWYFYLGGEFKDCYYDYFYINSDRKKKGFTFSVSF